MTTQFALNAAEAEGIRKVMVKYLAETPTRRSAPFTVAWMQHHGAVRIHPFSNGNGHWSRLLANIWLKLHGAPLIFWPEPSIGVASEVRGEYLDAIRAADRGEFAPLLALHQRFGSEHTD